MDILSIQRSLFFQITSLIIKITISSIVIGLKNSYSPLIHLSVVIGQFVIGHLVIGQFVIRQFNKPIRFKVVVKINQSHLKLQFKSTNHNRGFNHHRNKCTNSKIGAFFKMENFSLEQWLYFRRQRWFLLSSGTNVYANYPDDFLCGYADMLRWSSAFHSIVLYHFATTVANGGKHPPDWNTTAQYASISSLENPHFVQQNTGTMAVTKLSFRLVSNGEISKINKLNSKTAASKNIARATKSWMAA